MSVTAALFYREGPVTSPVRRPTPAATLSWDTFITSRLGEFCSLRAVVAQTEHVAEEWPLVVVEELIDNALDVAQVIGIPPVVEVNVSTDAGEIVFGKDPALLSETVVAVLDCSIRVSCLEAYVSPTRGAQGNVLKTVIAMVFIEARRIAHPIRFTVDPLRQKPRISHQTGPPDVTIGSITVRWPDLALEAEF